jgi:hypothetical protein
MALNDTGQRIVAEFVIVTIVSERGGALWKIPQVRLILLFEKGVLSGNTVCERLEVLGECETAESGQEKTGLCGDA